MSRHIKHLNENVTVAYGGDHALGQFFDIMDRRYAESSLDEQGEGYLVEWSGVFKFSQNQIGITLNDLTDDSKIIKLCDKFVEEKL